MVRSHGRVWLFDCLNCQERARRGKNQIMNRNRLTCCGISLALFCCAALRLNSQDYVESSGRGYRVHSELEATQLRFEQMMEQRDINVATIVLVGEGFTADEIREAVQNRNVRIGSWPGYFTSASGNIGGEGIEGAAGILVGPTYYLIVGHARLLRGFRQFRQ
jgi:hypothetical protein